MTKAYDIHTKKGRKALDRAVASMLHPEHGRMRGDIAEALGAPERAVSASLLRLVKAGVAARAGLLRSPTYTLVSERAADAGPTASPRPWFKKRFVYFALAESIGIVKIGVTSSIANRVRVLVRDCRVPFRVVALLPGGSEADELRRFQEDKAPEDVGHDVFRSKSECFYFTDRIKSRVDEIRTAFPDAPVGAPSEILEMVRESAA